ncbi:hypothetical protein GCM10009844_15840 [Nocardioides koreensis]|uniref:CdiI immunity protein domain-containing protein n=1 Tax=Nocardioides koreensis TaxID=433651 RepID=A0ABP5LD46_9ACTN
MTTTPALWEFLGGYLHQDWALEFTNEWQALDQFISDAPELASSMTDEINRVLSEHKSEDDLHAYLAQLGANFRPLDEAGYRGWLSEIARRVEAGRS